MVGGITIAHVIASTGLFVFTFGMGMSRFDNMDPAGNIERVLKFISEILFLPLFSPLVRYSSLGKVFHGFFGYIPIFMNSLIWGIGITIFYEWFKQRKSN